MNKPTHGPYAFVPLPATAPERAPFPGLHRYDGYSGVLDCELEVITALFTADHRRERTVAPDDKRLLLGFLRDRADWPIIQGASLRGMIRSLYEAAFPSCLPLAAGTGKSKRGGRDEIYRLSVPEEFRHERCADVAALCPACRLFGVILGDEVHAQGRVRFSDARLAAGMTLTEATIYLAELSSPKPHHYPIYSLSGEAGGSIRGRKLYFHQPAAARAELDQWGPRSNAIVEHAAPDARFGFRVIFENLAEEELRRLVSCLTLDAQHAHKLGMAKPLGFGSCRILIHDASSRIDRGASRFEAWSEAGAVRHEEWKLPAGWLVGALERLLRLARPAAADTGYLGYHDYRGIGIDEDGKYITARPAAGRAATPAASESKPPPARLAAPRTPAPLAAKLPSRAPGTKFMAEVMSKDASGVFTLRDNETGQDDILFKPLAPVPWKVGDRRRVRVEKVSPDGKVLKVGT